MRLWPTLTLQFCSWLLFGGRAIWRECIGKPCIAVCREHGATPSIGTTSNGHCVRLTRFSQCAQTYTQKPSARMPIVTFRRSRSSIFRTEKEITGFLYPHHSRSIPICIFKIILTMKIELMLSAGAAAVRCSSTCRQIIWFACIQV